MFQRAYLAVSALVALTGLLLLLGSPAVTLIWADPTQWTSGGADSSGHLEVIRAVGGLLLGTGLLAVTRPGLRESRPPAGRSGHWSGRALAGK